MAYHALPRHYVHIFTCGRRNAFLIERFLNATAAEVVPDVVTKGHGGSGVVGSNPPENAPKGVLYELRRIVAQS